MKIGHKLITKIQNLKYFAQGFSRAGIYHYINNGQIWADAVAGKIAVSLKALGEKFHSFDCCNQFRSYFYNFKVLPLESNFLTKLPFKSAVPYPQHYKTQLELTAHLVKSQFFGHYF